MFQKSLDDKQERDKQQKSDQNPVTSLVILAVKAFVLLVNKNGSDHESHQE
jgi:hypothetical protein